MRKGCESWACSASRRNNWEGTSPISINISREGVRSMDETIFLVPSNRARGRNWCTGTELRKNFVTVQVTVHGTDCPEKVHSVPHFRYSRTAWSQSFAKGSGMTMFEQGGQTRWSTVILSDMNHSVIQFIVTVFRTGNLSSWNSILWSTGLFNNWGCYFSCENHYDWLNVSQVCNIIDPFRVPSFLLTS